MKHFGAKIQQIHCILKVFSSPKRFEGNNPYIPTSTLHFFPVHFYPFFISALVGGCAGKRSPQDLRAHHPVARGRRGRLDGPVDSACAGAGGGGGGGGVGRGAEGTALWVEVGGAEWTRRLGRVMRLGFLGVCDTSSHIIPSSSHHEIIMLYQ